MCDTIDHCGDFSDESAFGGAQCGKIGKCRLLFPAKTLDCSFHSILPQKCLSNIWEDAVYFSNVSMYRSVTV